MARQPKARAYEDIKDISVTKLTDKEKEIVIKGLKSENKTLTTKVESLQDSCKSAFEQTRIVKENYDKLVTQINTDIAYISKTTAVFAESICRVTKGDN